MPPKQRPVKIEHKSALAAMQRLETRSDEELLAEQKYKAAAQAILGARAAERYDAKTARSHFQKAIAAARPQERMQLRRMAEASLALAERRADDLKRAAEKLGQTPPSRRQLAVLRFMGFVAPPPGSSALLRVRGFLILLGLVLALLLVGYGLVELVSLPLGGVGTGAGIGLGLLVVIVALAVLAVVGRRKQKKARERAIAQRAGARPGA